MGHPNIFVIGPALLSVARWKIIAGGGLHAELPFLSLVSGNVVICRALVLYLYVECHMGREAAKYG
jgi:hypothetical protein